jgi:hypothetical protein
VVPIAVTSVDVIGAVIEPVPEYCCNERKAQVSNENYAAENNGGINGRRVHTGIVVERHLARIQPFLDDTT